jgi:hypothetical protein
MATLRLLCLPAALALLGALGCVDHTAGGTTLYVYDNSTSTVQVWADINNVYSAVQANTAVAAPDRAIQSPLLSGIDLAWGGLAVDSSKNILYLVSEAGAVFSITKANTQNGSISAQVDITTFTLGAASDQFSQGSVFGQAAIDSTNNILYVMETATDGSQTRVWRVVNPNQASLIYAQPMTPASTYTIGISTDTFGTGVAVSQSGTVYGLFGGGTQPVYSPNLTSTGPRLRQGPGGSFPSPNPLTGYSGNLLIGANTKLADPLSIGSLGYDAQNNILYVFSGPTTSGLPPIVAFSQGLFGQGNFNLAPTSSLPDTAATLPNLRIISHPSSSDWLLGATYTADTTSAIGAGTGGASLLLWKSPSAGGVSAIPALMQPATQSATMEIRGMAIGGTN